ncbi:MAG TPA: endonuclease MutS2 [Candidatus Limnocylindrales bacterium]
MDRRSQQILEFPQIRARLAEQTAFAPSRRLAEALMPSSEALVVARMLDETDQARDLVERRPDLGVGGAHDMGPLVMRARRGGRLSGSELLQISETLATAARVGEALRSERPPLLHELGRSIKPMPQLRARLEQSLDPAGELLDSASPALGGLRRAVRVAYERLRSRLETIVHQTDIAGALQEPLVTLRNGRYVVPVRADARGRVKGIVHDQSGSGQTLFIEPLVVVELGNTWREAQLRAQAEEERILDELSELVSAQADALDETLAALATLDFWIARARLAGEMDAVRAGASTRDEVELLSARHPGLTGRVVPTDIRLGSDFRALVVTGPNTGGKTVTLRTLGLLSLMNQAGLHIPAAEGSRLPIFRDVFADIGDEQSIAQSLSTFSGHMRSIVRIVEAAGPDTLILLDELGAGTDPTEGSALAQALLDHFIAAGALVAATTHYAELKAYAHNTQAAENASVEFDIETLSPTYHLRIGLPGTSQAFAIAARLGLPETLVADARSRLGRAQEEFEKTLASIREAQQTTEESLARATEAEERARLARREAEEERHQARRERETVQSGAREEAQRALAEIQAEIRAARDLLARSSITEARLADSAQHLDERVSSLLGTDQSQPLPVPSDQPPARLAVGARARSTSGWEGTITQIDERAGEATLAAGAMHISVPIDELEVVADTARKGPDPLRITTPVPARAVPSSLDVRGARVEEATELLDRYVNDAALAGAPRVTVIHGHGSGALRDALRAQLRQHPLVKSWRPGERGEGGDGATIVEF